MSENCFWKNILNCLNVFFVVPSPTFQKTPDNKAEDKHKDTTTLDLIVKKEPAVTPPVETMPPLPCFLPCNSKSQNDDDCILLLPTSEDSLHLDSKSAHFLERTAKSFAMDSDIEHANKMKDQDESILRTLLLETADAASGMSHVSHILSLVCFE